MNENPSSETLLESEVQRCAEYQAASESLTWLERLLEQGVLTWHQRIPNRLDAFSTWGVLFALTRMLAAAAAGGVLLWIKLFSGKEVDRVDLIVSVAIWAGQLFSLWYDKIYKKPAEAKEVDRRRIANNMSLARVLEKILAPLLSDPATTEAVRARLNADLSMIRKLLLQGILEQTRVALRDLNNQYFEVSLIVFCDQEGKTMQVIERAGGRPRGAPQSTSRFLAFCALVRGTVFSEHDFRRSKFPDAKSITSPSVKAPYRSILFVPIFADEDQPKRTALGVVTIDSAKPFHFYYKETVLRSMIDPDLAVLRLILGLTAPKVTLPESS
jgi:hypothetical protein